MKGKFITFEGSEGSGKSTQSKMLFEFLKKEGFDVLYLREPGSTSLSEKIRGILLDKRNKSVSAKAELLLYLAARAQVVEEVIRPALACGKVVLCDRFMDSTLAYQGYGLGMDIGFIKKAGEFVTAGIQPGLTILFDLPAENGLKRCGKVKDRIESRPLDYHRRVRNGYLQLARLSGGRIKVIDGRAAKEAIQKKIRKLVLDAIR